MNNIVIIVVGTMNLHVNVSCSNFSSTVFYLVENVKEHIKGVFLKWKV